MKRIIKKTLSSCGFEVRRIKSSGAVQPRTEALPGSEDRDIGNIRRFLEDVRERGFQPRGIIDVGANRGNWTAMALSVFPGSSVIMIEPQEEMGPILTEMCHENPNLESLQAGAGREPGELVQTIWEDLSGSSFLPEVSEDKIREGKQRVTPIVKIDDLLKERPDFIPDLVKLDVQGFELEALSGAMSIFGKTEVFIMETSLYKFMPTGPVTIDCIQFMHEHGYDFYDVTEYLRRPFDGALGQIDLAFARAGGMLRRSDKWKAER